MDTFLVPRQAIDAFESLTSTRVTIHDLVGTLRPFLPPERFQHTHPLCCAVKVRHSDNCIAWGVTCLRREISAAPEGRVQVCFAGLVEVVVPVYERRRLQWVLFAGPRTAGKLTCAARDQSPPPRPSPWSKSEPLPSPIDDDEALRLLENLRQLAARLRAWKNDLPATGVDGFVRDADQFPDELSTRRTVIRNFIFSRHTQPVKLADLAEALHLSESRAGHAVKEACGETFLKLLTEARLRTAASLLNHTALPILDVALRSGFGEVSHFHRSFRERFRMTPLKYRKQCEAAR